MATTIEDAVKELLHIVKQLSGTYPKRKFTLDGRLVGDLGEVLVEGAYEVELLEAMEKHHDAKARDGRRIQIKTAMQNALTFPVDHRPDYYLGIKIHPNGTFTEIFNGPGLIAAKAVENRKPTKTNLHSIDINRLKRLSEEVQESDRIPRRAN